MMKIIATVFQFAGSLSFLLFGMKMLSDGIQKSAGTHLKQIVNVMMGNRVMAVMTGLLVTCIVQSSSATTVMIVSFVNSGLLSLTQAIGAIFGANIGTTLTAWIVSLFGFKFKIAVFAIPVFGVGFLLTVIKRLRMKDIGQALMGFGLLFLGLELLGDAIPKFDKETSQTFMMRFSGSGWKSLIGGIITGTIITIILDSSSAVTALIITMAHAGLLSWEFSAALVLGSNIGTTTDVIFSSIGAKANAKRAAFVHIFFNVAGSIIAALFFRPFISFVDWVTPGTVQTDIATHIAMFHTMFNVCNTLLFLPFVNQLARFTQNIITEKAGETPAVYQFDFERQPVGFHTADNGEGRIIAAEHEIMLMAQETGKMFIQIQDGITNRTKWFAEEGCELLTREENYIDQMREGISNYLMRCYEIPLNDKTKQRIPLLINITQEIERMSDDCFTFAMLLKKSIERNMNFAQDDIANLTSYIQLAGRFLQFVEKHLIGKMDNASFGEASGMEDRIDAYRNNLKKMARKRLEQGANVRQELLYIDLVRNIEKIGDCAFSIARILNKA